VSSASSGIAWAFLSAGLALVVILLAFGAALVIYQRRFLSLHRGYADGLVRAQEEERAWVAREVHDDALQRIAMLLHELDDLAASGNGGTAEIHQRLRGLRLELEDLSLVLRRMAYRLHPAFVEQEPVVDTIQRLAMDLARTANGTRIEVHDETRRAVTLTREQALVVYRIAHEALTNVIRHAAPGTAVVRVRASGDLFELRVEDRGPGFDVESARRRGLGLISMTERARAAGGLLSLVSQPGRGTLVYLRLPLAEAPA
jgi:signal transduction histidine kinase